MIVITKGKRSVAEFNEMMNHMQVCVQSKRDYADFDAIPYQLRDSIEGEWICRILNELQFQCEQQHPPMEVEKDTLLSELKNPLSEPNKNLKESQDAEFVLHTEQDEKNEWELNASGS